MTKTKAIGIALIALWVLLVMVAGLTGHYKESGIGLIIDGLGLVIWLVAYKEQTELAQKKKAEEEKQPPDDSASSSH